MAEGLNSPTDTPNETSELAYPGLPKVGLEQHITERVVNESSNVEIQRLKGLMPSNEFAFENNEALYDAPDVQLNELFSYGEFSAKVKGALDESGFAVVTGQSGIGKTELFCGQDRRGLHAGGITELLAEGNYSVLSLQQRGVEDYLLASAGLLDKELPTYAKEKVTTIQESKYLILDETAKLGYLPDVVRAINELHNRDKKILLVGGGKYASEEQAAIIRRAFSGMEGEDVFSKDNMFALPAYLLNDAQAMEILKAKIGSTQWNDEVEQKASFVLSAMQEQRVPTIYRAVEVSPMPTMSSSALERQVRRGMKRDLEPQIGHIKEI